MLAMIAGTILPEAIEKCGAIVGMSAPIGYLAALSVKILTREPLFPPDQIEMEEPFNSYPEHDVSKVFATKRPQTGAIKNIWRNYANN